MRDIKFRGYGIYGWSYGSLVQDEGKYYIVEKINTSSEYGDGTDFYATVWSEVSEESVGQFTGLTDCNGKEIYEGDIVSYGAADLSKVEYSHGAFWARRGQYTLLSVMHNIEVIEAAELTNGNESL